MSALLLTFALPAFSHLAFQGSNSLAFKLGRNISCWVTGSWKGYKWPAVDRASLSWAAKRVEQGTGRFARVAPTPPCLYSWMLKWLLVMRCTYNCVTSENLGAGRISRIPGGLGFAYLRFPDQISFYTVWNHDFQTILKTRYTEFVFLLSVEFNNSLNLYSLSHLITVIYKVHRICIVSEVSFTEIENEKHRKLIPRPTQT